MAHLTNGAIYYERRVKTGDWEHKFAHQTINYAFEDDDTEEVIDELLARARTLVVQHVHQTLRGNKEAVAKVGPDPVGSNGAPAVPVASDPVPDPDPVVDPSVVVPDELNRGFIIPESFTKPDEELLPRTSLKEAMNNFLPLPDTLIVSATKAKDMRAVGQRVIVDAPVTNLKAAKRAVKKRKGSLHEHDSGPFEYIEPPVSEPVDDEALARKVVDQIIADPNMEVISKVDDFTATAPAATDEELSQALSRVNAKLKDRPKIQALIGEFVQSGQSYVMIPAVRRTEFVTRLEALV